MANAPLRASPLMPRAPKRVREKFVLLQKKKDAKKALEEEIKELEVKCKQYYEKHKDDKGHMIIGHDGVDHFYRISFDKGETVIPPHSVDYLRVKRTKVKCEKLLTP